MCELVPRVQLCGRKRVPKHAFHSFKWEPYLATCFTRAHTPAYQQKFAPFSSLFHHSPSYGLSHFLRLACSRLRFPADKNTFEKPKASRIIITWVFFVYVLFVYLSKLPASKGEQTYHLLFVICVRPLPGRPSLPSRNVKTARGRLARALTATPFDPASSGFCWAIGEGLNFE